MISAPPAPPRPASSLTALSRRAAIRLGAWLVAGATLPGGLAKARAADPAPVFDPRVARFGYSRRVMRKLASKRPSASVAVVAAAIVGYTKWTVPDRTTDHDMSTVVGIASSVAEASATFTPGAPNVSIDRATSLMAPQRAEAYRNEFNAVAKDLTSRGVAGQASTISAGIETIGPNFASVAVVMRATQNIPNKPQQATVLGLRVTLTKQDDRWLVMDVTPIASR